MHRAPLTVLLFLSASLTARAQTSNPPPSLLISKGATVRMWSANHHLDGRKGWIDALDADSLHFRYPADARLETDPLWEHVALTRRDVDSIDVQSKGHWWRTGFTNAPPKLVAEPVAPPPNSLAAVPFRSPVRVWSRAYGLRDAHGVLLNQRPDTLDFSFTAVGARSIAIRQVDILEIPTRWLSDRRGSWVGFALGAVAGIVYTELSYQFKQNPDITIIPPHTVRNLFLGGGAGVGLGLLAARLSHRWKRVMLR